MPEDKATITGADSISLSDEAQVAEVLREAVGGLWQVVNNLTRLRPSKRPEFRVTIFGSARIPADHWVYGAVRDLAKELADLGCGIITGGGPGLMQAANEGAALSGPGHNVGIRVHLPFEQEVNAFVAEAYEHQTFFSRLHHFVLASDAFVVVPGGIGTVLELAMIWQLLQVRKLHHTPLILIGRMWAEFIAWGRQYLLRSEIPLASPEDFDIPQCVDTAAEAISLIRQSHQRWLKDQ
ncbi:MAG TPA: LOG family protein [Candidatus Binataceae bacterium]|nr:LOG family protein [Candidatus Binataceae bacterium]